MKLIITESKYRKIVFKYFDKVGGEIDENFISFFSLDGSGLTYDQAYKYLIEWRGEEESKELTKTLLLKNRHHINEYGSYDFFFEVFDVSDWDLDDSRPNVVVKVKVDDMAGTVEINGTNISLEDALDNEDYGWEIKDEVSWGIDEYFMKNIKPKTGIKIIFDRPKYTSRIFNFN